MTTPLWQLDEISQTQINKYITHNTALRQMEAILGRVLSRTQTAQPSNPQAGDGYILPVGKTGTDWGAQQDKDIAYFDGSVWQFYSPLEGWGPLWINDEALQVVFNGNEWQRVSVIIPQVLEISDTAYTLSTSDDKNIITFTSNSPVTLTLPETTTQAIAPGFQCTLIQRGSGILNLTTQGTETLESLNNLSTSIGPYARVKIYRITTSTWGAFGDLG